MQIVLDFYIRGGIVRIYLLMRALVVENNPDIRTFIQHWLQEKCFAVDTACDGQDALYLAKTNEYDIILLDDDIPKHTGFEVCTDLRQSHNFTPIILTSTIADTQHIVDGFTLGIDDYMTKPYSCEELFARMQAILRRPVVQEHCILTIDDVSLDTAKQQVTRGGIVIYLTRKEFSLLEYLLKHAGNVVSRGALIEHIWDITLDPFSNTIETHILNLRKKIDTSPKCKLIHSVPGRGYKIDIIS